MAVEPHSYLLLKDTSPCPRGTLLQLRGDAYYQHSHRHHLILGGEPCHPGADEVAPLTEVECVLLDSVGYYVDRYSVYSTPGRLAWGVGLKVGDTVLARLPHRNGSTNGQWNQYTTAVIRWAGRPDCYTAYKYGVEITVSNTRPAGMHMGARVSDNS